jgi:CRP/FNR family cyclic AMP-dependent transcriptional regulator
MKAGDAIIAKGALGAMMFVLVAGQVATAIDGRVVETLGPGAIFGETAMLGRVRRGASVTAQTDGAWLPLTKKDFLGVVAANPAIGVALLRTMSERIRMAAEQIRAHRPA